MENKKLTNIELQVLVNNSKIKHDTLKTEIFQLLDDIEERERVINEKLNEFKNIESEYVGLMKKMVNNGL